MRHRGCAGLAVVNQLAFANFRHAWMAQRSRRHRKVYDHRDVCGCGQRLTSQQVRIKSGVQHAVILLGHSYQVKEQFVGLQFRAEGVAQSAKQQTRSRTRPSTGSTVLRGD